MIVTAINPPPVYYSAKQIQKVLASPGSGQFPYQFEDGSIETFSAALSPVPNPTDWVIYARDQVGTPEPGYGSAGKGSPANPKVINAQVLANAAFLAAYQAV